MKGWRCGMSKVLKVLLLVVFLCFSISSFAQSVSYQRVINVISNTYTQVLSKQATSGAFVFGKSEEKAFFPLFTVMTLSQLRELDFPTNTAVFVKGVNFLDDNYQLSVMNNLYPLDVLLNLQGKTKVNLPACTRVLKDTIVKDYLLLATFPLKGSKTKSSSTDYYLKRLALTSLILDVVKYTDEKTLVRVLNGVADNVKVRQVDVNWMLPDSLAKLYENLSQMALKAYNGKNAVMTLYALAQINDVLLDGYSQKTEKAEMKRIERDGKDFMKSSELKKIIKSVETSQQSDGSWGIETLGSFQNSSINASKIKFIKVVVTSMNVYSLLKCGVSATSSIVQKGVEYLIHKFSNTNFLNKNSGLLLLQGFSIPLNALESYLGARWEKHFDVRKELPNKYLEYAKLNESKFADLLSKMYVSSMESYISQVVFGDSNF